MADNNIKIKTEIQTKQAEVQLATLENRMSKTAAKAESLRQSMSKLEGKRIATKEYEDISNQIAKASSEIEKLIDKQQKMAEAGKQGTPAFEAIDQKITELGNELRYAKGELQDLVSKGQAFTLGEDTEKYQRMQSQLQGVNNEMDIQNQKQGIMIDKMKANEKQTSKLASALSKARKFLSGFGSLMSKAFKSTGNSLKSNLMSVLKYTIGIQTLFALFRKLKSVAVDTFKEMAKQVPEVNEDISSMKTALNGLKASVGTMLQPLLSAVSGLITTIINKVTLLANAIGGLFARLTGQNYIYKATAAQEDYAKSLEGTGKSAKKTAKQLAAFDELNVINTQDDDAGGGGGSTPSATYSKEMIPEGIANIADTLKEMWNNGDFTSLGTMLGTKLQEALNNIPWEKIQATAEKAGKSLATLINGFVEVPQLGFDLGKTLGEGLNTAIYAIRGFLDNLHGMNVGAFIADMFNGLLTSVDWGAIGHDISELISKVLEMITGFLMNLDYDAIGTAISDLIKGVDWIKLIGELAMALAALVSGAFSLLFSLTGSVFDLIGDGFKALGMDSVAGFFYGMAENLRTSAKWLREWISTYIIEPIKNFLGIHSPSTVFAEIGKFLIEGLILGIKNMTEKIRTIFLNIKTMISTILLGVKEAWTKIWTAMKTTVVSIFEGIWGAIKSYINYIISGIEKMANGIISGVNFIIKCMNNLNFDIPDWIPSIGGKSLGFSIPEMSQVSIPRLAQGAVIPPNREFMAVLGDQKNGTNIEAPLDTIKEALRDTLMQFNNNSGDIVVQIDGYEVFRAVRTQSKIFTKTTGVKAFS